MNEKELSEENIGQDVPQSHSEVKNVLYESSLKTYDAYKRVEDKPTEELIQLALSEEDEDKYWGVVQALHVRGTSEAFEAAQRLIQSNLAKKRALGADILSQLGAPNVKFRDQSIEILLKLIETEQEPEVLTSIGMAFGHLNEPRAVEPLVKLKNHPDANVRFGVTFGMLTLEDDLAVKTLIELSQDEDDEVRDWATFGLGTQLELDTPEIREALLALVADENDDVRGEAFAGLAIRHDKRVIEPLLKELTSGSVGRLAVEAARDIADPTLYPALVALKEWWDVDEELLEEALEATSNKAEQGV